MNIESQIHINSFVPREYQRPVCDAISTEGGKYNKILLVNPRRCLSGDTHITMADGSFKYLRDIAVGDRIIAWDGSGFVEDVVKDFWSTGLKKTNKVVSPGYVPLISSDNHQFAYVHSGYKKVKWRSLVDLPQRARLLQYGGIARGATHNKELAEFWGFLLADGYVVGYQQPKFTNTNRDILKRVEYLALLLFDVEVIWRAKGNGFDLGLSNKTKGGGTFANPVKELFRSEGIDIPKSERRLPRSLWDFDEESLGSFFSALIAADGNIYVHSTGFTSSTTGNIVPPVVEVTLNCGSSDLYAWDIYWLLRKIGIVSQLPYKEKGSNWKIKVAKGRSVVKLLSYGPIYGKELAQQKAIAQAQRVVKATKKFLGCFRASYKTTHSDPEELFDIETEKHHNFIANGYVVHNSGKDYLMWALFCRAAIKKPGLYMYCLPTFAQARSVIWEGKTNTGGGFLDYIPKQLITKIRNDTMTITLSNGSIIRLVGSDSYDTSIVGSNPIFIVFSEYALCDENAYKLAALPIIRGNGGTVALISTPRGKNHLYELYQIARNNPEEWFTQLLTIEDTGHISAHEVKKEIASGEISEDLALQEYYCSFDRGQEGSYYAKYIDKMRIKGQIGHVPWEPYAKVHTAWDLGIKDPTVIIFFQIAGEIIRIIDYYEATDKPMSHFAQVIEDRKEQGWLFGKHFPPHDVMQRELSSGLTRRELYKQAGITFTEPVEIGIEDGIELVRRTLSKVWIDENNCKRLLKSLENYREEYDVKRKVYKGRPLHDWSSHASDGMRYLCAALPKAKDGLTPEALDKRYREAMYGDQANMPSVFRDDLPNHPRAW